MIGHGSFAYSELLNNTTQEYYPSGALKFDCQVSSGIGWVKEYFENGSIRFEMNIHGMNSVGKKFNSDGLLLQVETSTDNLKTSLAEKYYSSGKLQSKGHFDVATGMSEGIWQEYDESGETTAKIKYSREGKIVPEKSTFYTYDAVYSALSSECVNFHDGNSDLEVISNPMSFKNMFICMRMKIHQITMDGVLFEYSWLPSDADLATKYYFGQIVSNFKGNKEFIDGQIVDFLGKIVGTHTYTTTTGASKTVPKIKIYGITAVNH